jgi:hypothetical protein
MLFVAATIGFRLVQRRWEQLPQIAQTNRVEGLRALETGVFDVAKQKLVIAADALERLGDRDAAEVRQAAREAAIFADLANQSLEEIVEGVATRSDGASWFATSHKGRSVLLDARIDRTPEGRRTLDYRVFAGSKRAWIDLEGLRLLEAEPLGTPVTFGARLASVELEPSGQWRITFQPDSGVRLSTQQGWDALQTLGWPAPGFGPEDSP